MASILRTFFGKKKETSTEDKNQEPDTTTGVGILFDWNAIDGGAQAWQVFCESCNPKNLAENAVFMTDVEREACKIEIKALVNRQHAFCVALPDARTEQVNYVHNAVLSNAAKFILPETPFVPPASVGPWGSQIGRINFEGVFTLYDGDFLWVLLRAAKARWNCSVSTNELNRFLHAVKSCMPLEDDEMAIYAHAIGAYRLEQALANFRLDFSRTLMHWSKDERPSKQRECEDFIARLKRALGNEAKISTINKLGKIKPVEEWMRTSSLVREIASVMEKSDGSTSLRKINQEIVRRVSSVEESNIVIFIILSALLVTLVRFNKANKPLEGISRAINFIDGLPAYEELIPVWRRIIADSSEMELLELSSRVEKTLVNNAMTHLELGCRGVPSDMEELKLLCKKIYVE